MKHQPFSCLWIFAGLKPPFGNEFIRDSINSAHARKVVRKGRFDIEKQGKGRKSAAVRARVPQKQGLKLDIITFRGRAAPNVRARVPQKQGLKRVICPSQQKEFMKSGREFHKNKD